MGRAATTVRVVARRVYGKRSGGERFRAVVGTWNWWNQSTTANAVAGLFFPRSAALGLEPEHRLSPSMLEKVVYAGVHAASFQQASQNLSKLAEAEVSTERVRRETERIGAERFAQRQLETQAQRELSLPEQRQSPVDQVPQVACVQMDGGRIQLRKRDARGKDGAGFWRETKVGCLLSMVSSVSTIDPCPELPVTFADPARMSKIAREIKGISSEPPASEEADEAVSRDRPGRPQTLVRSVVASCQTVEEFGPHLAAAAYHRGFAAASRKAFVADGSEANWGVWRKHFTHYLPILDFTHALCYVYGAALAGRSSASGWQTYRDWAQWIWSGQVERVIAALQQRQHELGEPSANELATAPRQQVADALRYLRNQRSRMHYDEYRRQGLPITSSAIESTIKQINRRVKGSEKFWSTGADPMLALVADHLSQTPDLAHYWRDRHTHLDGARRYHTAA